jgi:hypothetical protein
MHSDLSPKHVMKMTHTVDFTNYEAEIQPSIPEGISRYVVAIAKLLERKLLRIWVEAASLEKRV